MKDLAQQKAGRSATNDADLRLNIAPPSITFYLQSFSLCGVGQLQLRIYVTPCMSGSKHSG